MSSPSVRPLPSPSRALSPRGIPPPCRRPSRKPAVNPPINGGSSAVATPPPGPPSTPAVDWDRSRRLATEWAFAHPSIARRLGILPPPMVPMLGPILALGPILLPPLPLPSPPALRPHPPMVVDPSIPRWAHPSAQGTSCLLRPLGPLLAFVPPLGPLWPIWPSRPSPSRPLLLGVSPIGFVGRPP